MMATLEGIQITTESLGHALADNNLRVPLNQRSYAWEDEHVQDLLSDLANAIAEGEEEYFLGSIVVTCKKGDQSPEVVDGQQRLATTSILLCAIRDYFDKQGDTDRAGQIEQEYLFSKHLRTQERVPKLRLNEFDNDYYLKRILSRPNDPGRKTEGDKMSHRLLDGAAKLASRHVKNIIAPFSENDATERLLDWIEYIRNSAKVIWVTVPDDANAYVIFETLNDRGLDLSIADLLKNYLFGRSGERIAEAQDRWRRMMGALETVTSKPISVTYIRHLWSSMYGPTRERKLYGEIKGKIKSKQAAIDFSTSLADEAIMYAALLNPEHEFWNSYGQTARRHVRTLRLLRMEQMRPLMLAASRTFEVKDLRETLRLLVSWSVRFLVVGGLGGGVMERHYAERATQIRNGEISSAKELAESMAKVVPSDATFEAEFATHRVSQSFLARYYLRALEQKAKDDDHPELVANDEETAVNLEHILPQSRAPEWSYVSEEEWEACYKRIGNMVLLRAPDNSAIDTAPFNEKRDVFEKSGFLLTAQVAEYSGWGADQIEDRQKKLAVLAVKTWPLTIRK